MFNLPPPSPPLQERSAQAMFNLGYLHEFGVGVQQVGVTEWATIRGGGGLGT